MVRSLFGLVAVGLVALTAGCSMCAHPYDYCGPTFTGENGQQCVPNARACSILSAGCVSCGNSETTPEIIGPMSDAKMVDPAPEIGQPIETGVVVRP